MRRIILASHGALAEGMKNTVEMIIGKDERIRCLMLEIGHHPDELKGRVEAWIKEAPQDEYIVLCDLFGGSVANAMMHLCTRPKVHVMTGMNLALVISLCTALDDEPIEDMIRQSLKETAKYILYANDLLTH